LLSRLQTVESASQVPLSLPAQRVDATPSAINLFSRGGVYGASETGEAFRELPGKQALNDIAIIPEYYRSRILGKG
jgi:hypothetical protein